jgi:hypothetical protein
MKTYIYLSDAVCDGYRKKNYDRVDDKKNGWKYASPESGQARIWRKAIDANCIAKIF